ncbi:hypothetical protein DM02DRAFT_631615 [Periconia macrospinosa]|uniref:Uncharacterized protein n=1 Tax=Periconia macrospinosa TaxID=97972 RepID=A0A2V1DFQ0_9PLEO|nr:hypothetical protein DM02DRAFT_631615 [Periconia macrospinosa]
MSALYSSCSDDETKGLIVEIYSESSFGFILESDMTMRVDSFLKVGKQRHLPGSYLTGMQSEINCMPRLKAFGVSDYEVSPEIFKSSSVLNNTIKAWNRLAPGHAKSTQTNKSAPGASFVRADSTSWTGNEVPLDAHGYGHVFQVTGLHQMHCLTSILRDYSLFLMGYAVGDLYDDKSIDHIRGHSAHCFNSIREGLMCLADGTSLGAGESPYKVADKGKFHVCNDFDALIQWATDDRRKLPGDARGES